MNSRRRVNSIVMSPFIDEVFGSSRNAKIVHGMIRLTCLSGIILFVLSICLETATTIHIPDWSAYWFGFLDIVLFFVAPVIFLVAAICESAWFRRRSTETRAIAVDWLFVIAYLVIWCFGLGTLGLPSP
jgi:hypothetical protein